MSSYTSQILETCHTQAVWMRNATYGWQSRPTVAKSENKGTCVTYVACVLQRLGILEPGEYVWHTGRGYGDGRVYGTNDKMVVTYRNNAPVSSLRNVLYAGDVLLFDDNRSGEPGSGGHILIFAGQWSGNSPYVWDFEPSKTCARTGQPRTYGSTRKVLATVRLIGAAYTPRLNSNGMDGNPYWYDRNPFYLAGYGLPNCTCYAWGRFWEIADIDHDYSNRPTLSTGNAEDWYGHTADGYDRGQTPQLGAVICFADGPFSGDGHVAIVELINEDGSIVTSNSAYGGEYFYTQTLRPPNYLPAAGYVFQGFIYNPFAGGIPIWIRKKIWLFKRALWHREEDLIK